MPCAACGGAHAPKRCAGCKAASYCDAACQAAHWQNGGHKAECRRLRDELARALGAAHAPAGAHKAEAGAAQAQGRGFLLRGLGGADELPAAPAPALGARTRRLVQSASSGALRAEESARAGRCIVASQPAPAGSLLMAADCYASVVSEPMAAEACSRCMARLPTGGVRCRGCATCFCAASCLEDAGPEHAAECPSLALLQSAGERLSTDRESVRLLLRVLARRAVEAAAPDGEADFRDVETLLAHKEQVDRATPLLSKAAVADGQLLLSMLPPPVAKGLQATDVTRLLLRIKFNSHPIYDSAGSSRIGLGLYPAAALMNHACAFNAVCSFAPGGAVLNVRAVRAIEPGEQVCYSYIDPYQARRTRRAQVGTAAAARQRLCRVFALLHCCAETRIHRHTPYSLFPKPWTLNPKS